KINYFNSADILLVPSIETPEGDKEGLPVVILEALSAGLPIIATNVGGIKDAVIDNYTGKLIEQKNSEAIMKAISELKNNKKLYNDISENCKKYAKKFDWSKIADKYILEIISSYNE
ncbi:MAG: glycosyltransferase, partial [Candidatus Heimdallarchaeota archaeon]